MEYKQLPRGYAEVLENTQLALIATIHKLYSMVRNNQLWELGEPELHDRGLPVIRNIAQKLGCIRPNSDIDLPVHSVFPEDEADMAELARQLEVQQKEQGPQQETTKNTDSSVYNRTDSASSSELDHSDLRTDDRKATYGSSSNALNLSPQSCAGNHNCDFNPSPPNIDAAALYPVQTPSIPNLPAGTMSKPQLNDETSQSLRQAWVMQNKDMLNQGLLKSEFGTIKPHEVMMGMGDPMIYSG
ncbi:Fluconazole resistance protein 1 [Fusarium falciforme]|nr:Fluconazole resistance protein 1 [Fusarium falciforme]